MAHILQEGSHLKAEMPADITTALETNEHILGAMHLW
jgi:hypothetical protein